MKVVAIPPTSLPGLPTVLDGTAWDDWALRGKVFAARRFVDSVRYVRLKPAVSCRLTVFDDSPDRLPTGFLVHLHPTAERAREALAKWTSRPVVLGPAGYEPFVDPTRAAVLLPFPNDPQLPALRHLFRPFRIKQALESILGSRMDGERMSKSRMRFDLLAYKPGRRAVFRVDAGLVDAAGKMSRTLAFHMKIGSSESFDRGFRSLQMFERGSSSLGEWSVPVALGTCPKRCIALSSWEAGEPLVDLLWNPDAPAALRATGRALAGLHRLEPVDLDPVRFDDFENLARDLAELLPRATPRLVAVGQQMAGLAQALAAGPTTTVHGDFHPRQVLVRGELPILVDFDGAGVGNPAVDVGNFLAYLIELGVDLTARDAFLAGYRERAPYPLSPETLSMSVALGLFRRSAVPFRMLEPDWPSLLIERVERAAQRGLQVPG